MVNPNELKELMELGDKEIPAWLKIPSKVTLDELHVFMIHLKSEVSEVQDAFNEMQECGATHKRIAHFLEELADVKAMATTLQESAMLMQEASGMPANAVFLATLMVNTKNRLRGYHEYDNVEG